MNRTSEARARKKNTSNRSKSTTNKMIAIAKGCQLIREDEPTDKVVNKTVDEIKPVDNPDKAGVNISMSNATISSSATEFAHEDSDLDGFWYDSLNYYRTQEDAIMISNLFSINPLRVSLRRVDA